MHIGVFILVFLIGLSKGTVFAQADHVLLGTGGVIHKPLPPKTSNDPVLEVDSVACVLPFTTVGGLILIKAKVDSTEGNFVFDTGAPSLILNKTYFRDVERIHTQDETQSDIGGENGLPEKAMISFMGLGSFRYYKIETGLLNLGHIENARGVKILGLLGVTLFKQCEVMIDYENKLLHLYYIRRKEQKDYKHAALTQPAMYEEHGFELTDNRIILQAKMGQKKLKFVVDSGSEANILDSRLPASIIDRVTINSRITLYGTSTRKVEAVKGSMPDFSFGSTTYDLPVVVTNLENTCFATTLCINGVLGFDFLSRSRLIFNFVTRKLYVLK